MDLQLYGALRDLFNSIDANGQTTTEAWRQAQATLEAYESYLDDMAAALGNREEEWLDAA